jgi:hypothetical protein
MTLLAACLMTVAQAGGTELYFEQKTSTLVGGKADTQLARVWFSGQRMRLETGSGALILRLDQGRGFRLDPTERVAWQLDLEALRAQSQRDLSLAEGLLPGGGAEPARTKPMPGSRTIAGHICRGYQIASPASTMQVWTARDVPASMETFSEFLTWTGANESLSSLLDALRALPGFPLETITSVDFGGRKIETRTTVTKLVIQRNPSARFEIPRGYEVRREPATEK